MYIRLSSVLVFVPVPNIIVSRFGEKKLKIIMWIYLIVRLGTFIYHILGCAVLCVSTFAMRDKDSTNTVITFTGVNMHSIPHPWSTIYMEWTQPF